jgi:hypothetical protein
MKTHVLALALAGFVLSPMAAMPTQAMPLAIGKAIEQPDTNIEKVARVARGGAAVRGPRGGVAVRRGGVAVGPRGGVAVRRGAVVAPGVRYGGWARPAAYRWRPGGAIAAGAAIGFVTAATAAAWAGAAPGPGLCWYYTDPGRTQGFWDACP